MHLGEKGPGPIGGLRPHPILRSMPVLWCCFPPLLSSPLLILCLPCSPSHAIYFCFFVCLLYLLNGILFFVLNLKNGGEHFIFLPLKRK